jgi:hypothetical protein
MHSVAIRAAFSVALRSLKLVALIGAIQQILLLIQKVKADFAQTYRK